MIQNLEPILQKVLDLLPKVHDLQISNFRTISLNERQLKGPNDLVSRVDIESEIILKDGLLQIIPRAGFYGEETGVIESSEWMWVVDPIDGTVNYLSGIDQFSISIALTYQKLPVMGIIYKPTNRELFSCIAGNGLFHNKNRISPHEPFILRESLIGTGLPFRNFETIDSFSQTIKDLLPNIRGIRRMGSAALDLAYAACGYFQGFWEIGLKPYDIAAGVVMLEEVGYHISNFKGQKMDIFKDQTFVCGITGVYEPLLKIIQKNYMLE